MFKRNVEYLPVKKQSAWRKIAIGTWRTAADPSVYGMVDLDARPILKTIEKYQKEGVKLTPTIIMAKAIATAFREYPPINGVLRLGRVYPRKNVDVFLQVAADSQGENLSGLVVRDCDQKSLEEISNEVKQKASRIKKGDDFEFAKVKKDLDHIPGFFMGLLTNILGFILYTLNLWSPLLGTPRDSFGSVMVTSVGMMGIEYGFAPLVPYSRCPVVMAIGEIHEKALVVDGKIEIRPILPLCATIDHRLVDGVGCSKMLQSIRGYLERLDQQVS